LGYQGRKLGCSPRFHHYATTPELAAVLRNSRQSELTRPYFSQKHFYAYGTACRIYALFLKERSQNYQERCDASQNRNSHSGFSSLRRP
jgi:hypothetical protein